MMEQNPGDALAQIWEKAETTGNDAAGGPMFAGIDAAMDDMATRRPAIRAFHVEHTGLPLGDRSPCTSDLA